MVSPLKKRPVAGNHLDTFSASTSAAASSGVDRDSPAKVEDEEESSVAMAELHDEDDDGYAEFLLTLMQTDSLGQSATQPPSPLNEADDNDDEEEYRVDDEFELDEDEESDSQPSISQLQSVGPQTCQPPKTTTQLLADRQYAESLRTDSFASMDEDNEDDESWILDARELEDELGDLLQEDMEAAISALIKNSSKNDKHLAGVPPDIHGSNRDDPETPPGLSLSSLFPLAAVNPNPVAATMTVPRLLSHPHPLTNHPQQINQVSPPPLHKVVPTQTQWDRLVSLMNKQYQLLLQQTVLAVRAAAAHSQKHHKEGTGLCRFLFVSMQKGFIRLSCFSFFFIPSRPSKSTWCR